MTVQDYKPLYQEVVNELEQEIEIRKQAEMLARNAEGMIQELEREEMLARNAEGMIQELERENMLLRKLLIETSGVKEV
jgi:hypothetical protein